MEMLFKKESIKNEYDLLEALSQQWHIADYHLLSMVQELDRLDLLTKAGLDADDIGKLYIAAENILHQSTNAYKVN